MPLCARPIEATTPCTASPPPRAPSSNKGITKVHDKVAPPARTRVDLAGHAPLHRHALVGVQVAHALQHLLRGWCRASGGAQQGRGDGARAPRGNTRRCRRRRGSTRNPPPTQHSPLSAGGIQAAAAARQSSCGAPRPPAAPPAAARCGAGGWPTGQVGSVACLHGPHTGQASRIRQKWCPTATTVLRRAAHLRAMAYISGSKGSRWHARAARSAASAPRSRKSPTRSGGGAGREGVVWVRRLWRRGGCWKRRRRSAALQAGLAPPASPAPIRPAATYRVELQVCDWV